MEVEVENNEYFEIYILKRCMHLIGVLNWRYFQKFYDTVISKSETY